MLVHQWGCESFNWHLLHGKPCFHDTAASSTPRHPAGGEKNAYLYTLPAADLVRKTQFIIKLWHKVQMYIKRDGRFPKNCCSIGKRAWLRISSYIYFHFISFSRGIKVDLELERSTNASICTTNPGVTKRPRGWKIHRGTT